MSPKHHEQALLLLCFLQQRQRKMELEQTLVLAEAQGSPLVILPRQHIFSWKKKPKVDVQAVRRELSEIERHPLSLSSQACLEIAAQLLKDAKQSEDRSAQTGAELIEQALKLEALAENYDVVISQSYDTRGRRDNEFRLPAMSGMLLTFRFPTICQECANWAKR